MLNREQRREDRVTLTAQPKGHLLIHIKGECIPVKAVRDISSTGISLVYIGEVIDGGDITLEYRSKGIDLKVEGSVMWVRKENGESDHLQNVMGLQLFGPTLLLAAMLDN
jgi:hypothetical protein